MTKRYFLRFLIAPVILYFLSSCKVLFTENMRQELIKQEIPLNSVQYYVSKKVKLRRLAGTSTITKDSVDLVQKTRIEIDLVKIKRNTKGVIVGEYDTEIAVSFEECESCSLKFVKQEVGADEIYPIGAAEWVGNVGRVDYNDKTYYIAPRNFFFQQKPNNAALKVKNKQLYKFKLNKRKAKGRRVVNK